MAILRWSEVLLIAMCAGARKPLLLLTLCASACAPRDSADAGDAATALRGLRPSPLAIAGAVDSLATRAIALGLTPGLGVAVVMDGRTVLAKSYGMADIDNKVPADDNTLWYVASTSKSYTGFGISLLAQQGVVDFQAPITTLLPNAQWPRGVDASKLTLAHFLSHTHQLGDNAIVTTAAYTGAFHESEWPAMLRFARPMRGHDLVYTNLGYNVAAMVIDAKRPEGWRRYLDSAVYKPAGLNDTYTRISGIDPRRLGRPHDLLADGRYVTVPFYKVDATMNSAGGHLATMHDLARWVAVQMDSGIIDGKQVFPKEAVALSHHMIARQTQDDRKRFAFFDREGWAAGWDIGSYEGEAMVSRFGSYSSLRSHLSFLPQRRIGVVTQANGPLGSGVTDIVAAFAYDLERGDANARTLAEQRLQQVLARRPGILEDIAASVAKRAARQKPLRRPLTDFAGSYRHEWYGTVTFEVRDGKLYYTWGALHGEVEVLDAGKDVLRIEVVESGNSVAFDFPRVGPATTLELRGETFRRR